MKYLPTLDLWDAAIHEAVRTGRLVLQCGQWVRCGPNGSPARWVALRPGGTMWVAHAEGDRKTTQSFRRLREVNKQRKYATTT